MKLKELEIVGGSVYLNIVNDADTQTMTMDAEKAVAKYGELEVIEHTPYVPDGQETSEQENDAEKKSKKERKPGTDVVILKG